MNGNPCLPIDNALSYWNVAAIGNLGIFPLMTLWILLIGIPMLIGLWAQSQVSAAFHQWKQVRASSNITGAEAAREILAAALTYVAAFVAALGHLLYFLSIALRSDR